MEKFLEQIELSKNAISLYLKALNNTPLTYYELYSLIPKVEQKEFDSILKELIDRGLLIIIESSISDLLTFYHIIPPIEPILNYFNNINTNFQNIESQIQELIEEALNEKFQKENKVELDTIYNKYQELRKDFEEDSLLQKRDIEDNVESIENVRKITDEIEKLYTNIKGIAKLQFANIVKTVTSLRKALITQIEKKGFKKEKEIIETIDKVFKGEQENLVNEFIKSMENSIEEEFKKMKIQSYIQKTLQDRNEMKMILLNMLSNYEIKFNNINDLISAKKEELDPNLENLKNKIIEELNFLISRSLEEISSLNSPILKLLNDYKDVIKNKEDFKVQNIWYIQNITRINEELALTIPKAKDELTIIIPKIENHLTYEELQDISKDVRIKLVSSDPHVNSLVKKFKELPNLEFRNFDSKNIIAFKMDNQYAVLGVLKEDKQDPIDDFIGYGTNYIPIVNLMSTIFRSIWGSATPDKSHPLQSGRRASISNIKQDSRPTPNVSPYNTNIEESKGVEGKIEEKVIGVEKVQTQEIKSENLSPPIKEIPPKEPIDTQIIKDEFQVEKIQGKESEVQISESKASKEFISNISPNPDDQAGNIINNAFNSLLSKLEQLKGIEFSKKLEEIADIILENKGFSVTLHSVRSIINEYKNRNELLSEVEKKEIFESIENWKSRLF